MHEHPCLQPLLHTSSVDCLQYQQLEAGNKAVHLLNEAISVISVWLILVQVGNNFVVDASQEEEGCATSRLSVAVNSSSHTLTVIKDGPGGIPYSKLHESITVCPIETHVVVTA